MSIWTHKKRDPKIPFSLQVLQERITKTNAFRVYGITINLILQLTITK